MKNDWKKENESRLQAALVNLRQTLDDLGASLEAENAAELHEQIQRLTRYESVGMLNASERSDLIEARFERERMLKINDVYPMLLTQPDQKPAPKPAAPADQADQADPDLNTTRRAHRRRPSTKTILKVVALMGIFGFGAVFSKATASAPAAPDTSTAPFTAPATPAPAAKPTAKPTQEPKRVVPADCTDANYYGNALIKLHYEYVNHVGDLLAAYQGGDEQAMVKARNAMEKNHEKFAASADSFRLGDHACK